MNLEYITLVNLLTNSSMYYASKRHDIATHIADTYEIDCKDNSRESILEAILAMSGTQLNSYADDLKELFDEEVTTSSNTIINHTSLRTGNEIIDKAIIGLEKAHKNYGYNKVLNDCDCFNSDVNNPRYWWFALHFLIHKSGCNTGEYTAHQIDKAYREMGLHQQGVSHEDKF